MTAQLALDMKDNSIIQGQRQRTRGHLYRREPYVATDKATIRWVVLEILPLDRWLHSFDITAALEMYPSDVALELHDMVKEGLIEEREVYYGSDSPSKPGYLGFQNAYRRKAAA